VEPAEVEWLAVREQQVQRLQVAAEALGKLDQELALAKVLHQALPELQLNMAVVEMVTTLLEQQEPHDQVQEVMA
jgi:hypothetical protein